MVEVPGQILAKTLTRDLASVLCRFLRLQTLAGSSVVQAAWHSVVHDGYDDGDYSSHDKHSANKKGQGCHVFSYHCDNQDLHQYCHVCVLTTTTCLMLQVLRLRVRLRHDFDENDDDRRSTTLPLPTSTVPLPLLLLLPLRWQNHQKCRALAKKTSSCKLSNFVLRSSNSSSSTTTSR